MDLWAGLPGNLWQAYRAGGFVMHPITACSLLALAVILYKLAVFRGVRGDAAGFMAELRQLLLDGRIADAIAFCARNRTPMARVMRAGLLKYGAPRAEVEGAMEVVAIREIARLESWLGALATVTTVAPLLGFLGTVVGMEAAFGSVAQEGLAGPGPVARGLAVAFHAAAWGLIVACVTHPFHNYFATRVGHVARDVEAAAQVLLDTFSEMERLGKQG